MCVLYRVTDEACLRVFTGCSLKALSFLVAPNPQSKFRQCTSTDSPGEVHERRGSFI